MTDPRVPFLIALACCCVSAGWWIVGALVGLRACWLAIE